MKLRKRKYRYYMAYTYYVENGYGFGSCVNERDNPLDSIEKITNWRNGFAESNGWKDVTLTNFIRLK